MQINLWREISVFQAVHSITLNLLANTSLFDAFSHLKIAEFQRITIRLYQNKIAVQLNEEITGSNPGEVRSDFSFFSKIPSPYLTNGDHYDTNWIQQEKKNRFCLAVCPI